MLTVGPTTRVFERFGTHKAKYGLTAAELTPAAYARDHPGKRAA